MDDSGTTLNAGGKKREKQPKTKIKNLSTPDQAICGNERLLWTTLCQEIQQLRWSWQIPWKLQITKSHTRIESLNSLMSIKVIKLTIKTFLPWKLQAQWLLQEILSNIYGQTNANLTKSFGGNKGGGNTFQLILWGHHNPDTKTWQDNYN